MCRIKIPRQGISNWIPPLKIAHNNKSDVYFGVLTTTPVHLRKTSHSSGNSTWRTWLKVSIASAVIMGGESGKIKVVSDSIRQVMQAPLINIWKPNNFETKNGVDSISFLTATVKFSQDDWLILSSMAEYRQIKFSFQSTNQSITLFIHGILIAKK